ncbi:hypothetical protein [Streptomyces sp. NPDC058045]|uniref:hypothetical protein n=1 Tax=Streptomyces sp. NPDC058045 TaxID=3346311 RepID=UPI0036E37CEA
MINPSGIPQFTGDFEQLDKDVSGLRKDAVGIRGGGTDVHSRFQMLGAYYTAPEADELFATTQPVMDKADTFAAKLETVADALDTFAAEARPLALRLEQLKADALEFTASVEGDDDWTEDQDKTDRNKELVDGASATTFAFEEAERRAAGKISALVGGPAFVTDHGSGFYDRNTVTYGRDLELLKNADELPWGSADEQTHEAWSSGWFAHSTKSFVWDGIYHDGIEAGLSGLWTMAGGNGGSAASEAWGGLKDVVTGVGLYTLTPYDAAMDWAFGPDQESADEIRAKKAAKEFGKALVAWDQWQENPTRAAGTASFNILTLGVGPLTAISRTSEIGAVAKGARAAATIGEVMDPLSLTLKATSKAATTLPKLSDLTSRIFNSAETTGNAGRVHSVIELEDGSKVVIENGEFIAYDGHGEMVHGAPGQEESVSASDAPENAEVRDQEFARSGAVSRVPESASHGDSGLPAHTGIETSAHSGGPEATTRDRVDTGPAGGGGRNPEGPEHGSEDAAAEGDLDIPEQRPTPERPSLMHEGPNPYGPRGSLTREQIEEIQVYRANHEPGYIEHYYRINGTRRFLNIHDESGFTPPHLHRPSEHAPWVRAKDVPEPPEPHFLDADYIRAGEDTVTSPVRRQALEEAAQKRHLAVQWDHTVERWKEDTGAAHQLHDTIDSAAQWSEAKGAYKESHTSMGYAAEEFGDKAARYHYMAERYPDFQEQHLLGPKNGNDQFDQVWKHRDGRIVVIEAKSSPDTRLGKRTLEDGRRVSQGSQEYFHDIIGLMIGRGEISLARDIRKALAQGKLEYVLVRGEKNSGTYAGHQFRRFDISRGTLS